PFFWCPTQWIAILSIILCHTRCQTPSLVATQSIQAGDMFNNQHKYDQAIIQYNKYLEISPQLGIYRNLTREAEVCRKLAHAYSTQGQYLDALNYLNKALKIDNQEEGNELQVIEDYRQIGIVHSYMGNYKESLKNLGVSLELNEGMERSAKNVKRLSVADTYMSLAQVQITLGNFQESKKNAEKALELYKKISGEFSGPLEAQLILGIISMDMGDLDNGIEFIMRSKQLAEQNGLNTARHNQYLGQAQVLKGEYEEGLRYKLQALEEAEKSNIRPQIIWANIRVGDVFQKIGDFQKADQYYEKALRLQSESQMDTTGMLPSLQLRLGDVQQAQNYFIKAGANMGAALASMRLGEMRVQEGKLEEALELFLQAEDLFQKVGSNEGKARAKLELGKLYIHTKQYLRSATNLSLAATLSTQPDIQWQVWFHRGQLYKYSGRLDSARIAFDQAISIIEELRGNLTIEEFKTLFADTKLGVYDQVIMLLLNNRGSTDFSELDPSPVVQAFNYCEQARSRTFLDMLGNNKIDPKQDADDKLLAQEQALRLKIQQIGKELQKSDIQGQSRKQLQVELTNTLEEHEHLLQLIKLKNPAYATVMTIEPPSLAQIQSTLDKETVLLEYWMSEKHLVIWIISKNKIEVEVLPIEKAELQKNIQSCRRLISLRADDLAQEALNKVYHQLITPIQSKIDGYQNLGIIPHRTLHFLPFQALVDDDNKYLIEKYNLFYAPSASIYHHCTSKSFDQTEGMLGMALGDLSIGNNLGLPGTELEVKQISQLYPQIDIKLKNGTTETYLKQQAQDYSMIHIATHGILNSRQPLYSYLLLSPTDQDDGQLEVHEIFGLNLNAKLITLSACETGLGDLSEADELVGLSRAFIYAGTPAVIVSLWTVDDASTALLMTRMYQYIHAKYTLQQALTLAQRDVMKNDFGSSRQRGLKQIDWHQNLTTAIKSATPGKSRNPYFWAPFVLIGNGNIR
ncbi:MAG: CHAT domain-containing protein, partial [Bacteroidetes bacterium]|nr:CHAT domain-containing protein [Bacteroidota bacterium]